jgi:predicted metal-dependent phosphoesterase TrpH
VIDLHCHTTASDGALAPAELVAHAHELGVTVLGVTDHDTIGGLEEALAAGDRLGLRVVPGVEISVRGPKGSMHLLGYFEAPRPEPLATRIEEISAFRANRNRMIVERLCELGVPVAWEDVERRARGQVGRPHIAEALVAAGHVETKQEAFDRYLAAGMPGYVEAGSLGPVEAVELICRSGGAPVLAHPSTLKLEPGPLSEVVGEMRAAGLRGLEVYRPDHDDDERALFLHLCDEHDLVPSGGSDYHRSGDAKGVEPGDTGALPVPEDTLSRLLARTSHADDV